MPECRYDKQKKHDTKLVLIRITKVLMKRKLCEGRVGGFLHNDLGMWYNGT